MHYGLMLLSKVIDNNDVAALARFGITESDFATEAERQAYRFIVDYAESNRGNAPSYATVAAEVDEFTYIPEVADSYEYLARQVKSYAAKMAAVELLQNQAPKVFEEKDGNSFIEWLISEAERIKIRTDVRNKIGKTLQDLSVEYYSEYLRRKEGKTYKAWKTPFNSLNEYIKALYTGDCYGVIAESGRGKTYLLIKFVDSLLRQGANVLVKSFELTAYSWLSRLFSVLTAEDGRILDEFNRKVGLPNRDLLAGKLDESLEPYFLEIIDTINDAYPGKLYLQAKGDSTLTRSLDDLDRELKMVPEIDVVVIDPFYSLSDVYNGRNVNKTTGGAAELAARRFEQIIGENNVVGIYSVQATVEKKSTDENGNRELKLPTRDQVKTSKALLEIATNLFSFDSAGDRALLGIEKGRNGAEDLQIELISLLDYGVLRELETGEEAASQFSGVF
jgi:replicative DNA helicase